HRPAQLFRRRSALALPAIPGRRRSYPVRHRPSRTAFRGWLRDDLSPVVHTAAPACAGRTIHLRPDRQRREHLKTSVRHSFSLFARRRKLSAVGGAPRVLAPRSVPDAGRADARRTHVFLDRTDHHIGIEPLTRPPTTT